MSELRWLGGDALARRALDVWRSGAGRESAPHATLLHDNPRRRLLRLDDHAAGPLLLKQFRVTSGKHPWRERAKAWLGLTPARREQRALAALFAAGVPVPEPLGLARLREGDFVLVLRFVEGVPLAERLARSREIRRGALASLATGVRALHAAGFVHGDLHHGNVLVTAKGEAVLLDLQHAWRTISDGARARDLGFLDYALAPLVSRTDRLRVHRAALGVAGLVPAAAKRALRAVFEASRRRTFEHAEGRTRRALRPGRAYAGLGHGHAHGLRVRDVEEAVVLAALGAHHAAVSAGPQLNARVVKQDGRSQVTVMEVAGGRFVVKQVRARGVLRPLADLVRGSPGWRAWRASHGLRVRRLGAARAVAYLERRRLGVPVASWVFLEDLAPAIPADRATDLDAPARDRVVEALGLLARGLHLRGADHGDLKASHVFVWDEPAGTRTWLIDLEGVRFRRHVRERRRLRALAQLNASLPDAFPAEARRRAFVRYAAALPFTRGRAAALAEIVRESLARRHRWTGDGCSLARSSGR